MSEVRANSITNAAGTGAPDLPNGLTVADGTAAAPSITNTDDTNTGVFFPAADTVAIATNGTERMRVVNGFFGGYVGINTTTPSAALNVASVGTSNVPTVTGAAMRIEQGPFGYSETVLQIAAGDQGYGSAAIYMGVGALSGSTRIGSGGASSGFFIQENSGGPIRLITTGGEGFRVDAAGNAIFYKGIIETVFALSGTTPALDPSNGTIQTWTLPGNSSPTDSLVAGESMTLMIDDGSAFTITWPSVTWKTNAGAAPTLNTTGFTAIVLWKVGTTLYGARVGDA